MTDLQDLPFFEDPSMNNPSKTPGLSYRDAGVDIDAGDALVDRIKPLAKKTMRDGVLAGIGGFGALFEVPKRYQEPILVSGTDGVGTKLKLAFERDAHETIGQDLVAMSVNDILVQGASFLFFAFHFMINLTGSRLLVYFPPFPAWCVLTLLAKSFVQPV